MENNKSTKKGMKLYYHKTDGGAEYLCSEAIDGTDEGCFGSEYIVRIDGDIKKDTELIKNTTKKLTQEETDKILQKLRDYNLAVVDMDNCPNWIRQPQVSEEYFNEKVNEALE